MYPSQIRLLSPGIMSVASVPNFVYKSRYHAEQTYKTQICDTWRYTGECSYGLKCLFAHGRVELRRLVIPSPKPQIYPVVPPLPPGPPPPFAYPPLPPGQPLSFVYPPLPPGPPPPLDYPNLPFLGAPPSLHSALLPQEKLCLLSDWSSVVKTIEVLHKSLKEASSKKTEWFVEEECVVCSDKLPTHAFMPCKHVAVCTECAPNFVKLKQMH